jgi:hypothetical protein
MVGGDVMTPSTTALGCMPPAADGSFICMGSGMMSMPNGDWSLSSWNMTLDPDPIVDANTVVRNMTGSTQTFFLNVVLPITVVKGPPLVISGSIQGGVTDTNGSGSATLSSAGVAIYSAAIDGTVVKTLLNHPSSVTATGAFQSNGFSPSPGFSTLILPGNTATTNIAIRLRFNLTAGDSASFTSVFNVVPEPSTAVLAGLGLLGLLVAGRRAARR